MTGECPIHPGQQADTCSGCVIPDTADNSGSLDQLIQRASVPSLASLFKKAKEAGVIGPVSVYGEGSTPS